jgi:hypothetical protein
MASQILSVKKGFSKLQGEFIFVSLQLDAHLVAEIEAFAHEKGIESTEQALITALVEFFRDHRDCKTA